MDAFPDELRTDFNPNCAYSHIGQSDTQMIHISPYPRTSDWLSRNLYSALKLVRSSCPSEEAFRVDLGTISSGAGDDPIHTMLNHWFHEMEDHQRFLAKQKKQEEDLEEIRKRGLEKLTEPERRALGLSDVDQGERK